MRIEYKDLPVYNRGTSPEFEYCKDLLKQGVDPETKVEFLREGKLAFTITTIKAGANLMVENDRIRRVRM